MEGLNPPKTIYRVDMKSASEPVIEHLLKGIQGFQSRFYDHSPEMMKTLSEKGQHPKVLLIACSDSRVDPAILTGARPGDLFVIRNVANLVPPFSPEGVRDGAGAAIEYAVRDLKVEHIVVLGHAQCGGIKAFLSGLAGKPLARDFIGGWVSMVVDSALKFMRLPGEDDIDVANLANHQHLCERASIRGSIANLRSYPWIESEVAAGRLQLHGWWFDLETGDLWCTDSENQNFLPRLDDA